MSGSVDLLSASRRLRVLVVMLATMILTIGLAASVALAVPAAPMVRTLSNPDGTTIQARQWGDEWYHGWETLEGYTIVKDEHGFWCYAEPDVERGLVPSPVRVNGAPSRTLPQHVRPPREFLERLDEMRQAAVGELKVGRQPSGPSVGHFPVLLITFSDREPTYTQGNFDNLLFGGSPDPTVVSGPGTMKNFYQDVSFGQYSVQGVVGGWYTAANPHDYYGKNHPYYGVDLHPASLVAEAVRAADTAGFDWTPYDSDDDGYVDVVAVVHQGNGEEEGADPNDIWSHSWSLSSAAKYLGDGDGPITTHDGKIVDRYIIMPELLGVEALGDWYAGMATVGVFCHEYGHAIGLPDLYDTDYSSEGIGNWGLMGGGSWNWVKRPGDSPAYMTAWSRVKKGWLTPEQVASDGTLSIPAVQTSGKAFQILDGPEHFLLENRQPIGFDAGLPGFGLLIWHIDDNLKSNSDDTHRMVDLEEADGLDQLDKTSEQGGNRGDDGDPYPGRSGNRAFAATTHPSNILYDGCGSGVAVVNISDAGTTMSADIVRTSVPDVEASAVTPMWGAPPLDVSFIGAVTDADNDIAETWWAFSDGTQVAGTEAHKTYVAPGVYNASFYAVDRAGNKAVRTFSVVVAPENAVVFVDDDQGHLDVYSKPCHVYFTDALDGAGIPYVTTRSATGISPEIPYPIVWNCADTYPMTLTADDRQFLTEYLDGGGRLFLAGEDILQEMEGLGTDVWENFVKNYLHVTLYGSDFGETAVVGVEGDPISDGLSISLDYPIANYSDIIIPTTDAVVIFTEAGSEYGYQTKGYPTALRYEGTHRIVFFAFPFEAIPSIPVAEGSQETIPSLLMRRIVDFLYRNDAPSVEITAPTEGALVAGKATIAWRSYDPDGADDRVTVDLYWSSDGGTTWQTIATGQPASGTCKWDTSRTARGGDCLVRAVATDPYGGTGEDRVTVKVGLTDGLIGLGPNPASTFVNVYHSPVPGTIFVYDIAGRLVASHSAPAGESQWVWGLTTNDGEPVANGLYLIIFVTEDGQRSSVARLIVQR